MDASDDRGNQHVGVGVSVAVRVRGQIVWEQEVAHLKELADGFAVIARHTGSETLRGFDSTRGRLNGQAGNRDRRPRAGGIGN